MIVACYQRTMAGAAQRAAERGRTLVMELPAPKVQPKPTAVPKPPRLVMRRVPDRRITPRAQYHWIIDLVARMHGSTLLAVMSKRRLPGHTLARQAAVCAVREAYPDITIPHLARVFGRDHSTIYNSFRKRGYKPEEKP